MIFLGNRKENYQGSIELSTIKSIKLIMGL